MQNHGSCENWQIEKQLAPMNSEKLRRIEDIYHRVLEIDREKQGQFLRESCDGDNELRREVESLLSFRKSSDDLLKTPPESLAAEMIADENENGFIGKEIGHYKINKLLGIGGMGEVYLAEDTKLERQVALKFLPQEFVEDSERMDRFVREAKSASALNHPNILTIYEINEIEGIYFIATEFIDGLTLSEYAKDKSLNIKSVLEIAFQIVSALDEAHIAGIVHRDIKPDNIMVRSNGLVKILDFGIAKPVKVENAEAKPSRQKPKDSPRLDVHNLQSTKVGAIIGTADYMSPEQANGQEIDTRTDLFSVGVVLYEMISGCLPFDGETPIEMISAIQNAEPRPFNSEVPAEITVIVRKCLRKNRTERYQSAEELLNDLEAAKRILRLQNQSGEIVSTRMAEAKTQILKTSADKSQSVPTNKTFSGVSKLRGSIFAAGLVFALLVAAGFFSYRYFLQSKQIESIAVMPFVNASNDSEIDYLSDGMTETLIRNLSNMPEVSVKSRSAVFHYKGKDASPKKIGEELDVQAVLLGRIRQKNDDLELSLELVETETQNVLWTNQYKRRQSELLFLQSDIALNVFSVLTNKLSQENKDQITKNYPEDAEAYKLYLQGRYQWNKRTKEGYQHAIKLFQQAIARDPGFALAYVGLADSTAFLYSDGESRYDKAETIVRKALELDNELGEAHTTLGMIFHNTYSKWAEAEKQYKLAIDLNPNYATSHHWYGELLMQMGRVDESLKRYQKAAEIDPFSMPISADLGIAYYFSKQSEKAIEQLNKTIEREPNFYRSYFYLARIYENQGEYKKAIEAGGKGLLLANRNADLVQKVIAELTSSLETAGEQGYWKKRLAFYPKLGSEWGVDIVGIYLRLGEKEKAFAELEKAYQEKDFDLLFLKVTPEFDAIRDEPRFRKLVRQFGL